MLIPHLQWNAGTMFTIHHTLVVNNASFILRKSVQPGMWYGDRGIVIRTCAEKSCFDLFNLLAPEFGIQILAHPVCKM